MRLDHHSCISPYARHGNEHSLVQLHSTPKHSISLQFCTMTVVSARLSGDGQVANAIYNFFRQALDQPRDLCNISQFTVNGGKMWTCTLPIATVFPAYTAA